MVYNMTVAGVNRDLPLCKVTDDLYIGAFVIFGDVELTVAAAGALLERAPEYDYMIRMLPEGFFFDMVIRIAVIFIVMLLGSLIVCVISKRLDRKEENVN